MTGLHEVSPHLLRDLTRLGDDYGPAGVLATAMQLWPTAVPLATATAAEASRPYETLLPPLPTPSSAPRRRWWWSRG